MTARYPQSNPDTSAAQSDSRQSSIAGTGPNPNATGATMRLPYAAGGKDGYDASPRFEDYYGAGEGQIHSYQEECAQDTYPQPNGDVLDGQMEGG